jgi:adenosylhomocysteine nucleosidase
MSDLAFDDPCIVFALRREAAPFYRAFRPHQRFAGAPCRARFCGPAWLTVLVLETDVGAAAAESAVQWLLSKPLLGNVPYRPKLVLSTGFSGALRDDAHVGDIILATEIVDSVGNRWPTTWPGELPAGEWRPPLVRGRLLCVSELVGKPSDKKALGQGHDAVAVDMESAAIARLCSKHEVPFGCVRAISDHVDTELSRDVAELIWEGRVSPWRLTKALVRSPGLVRELWGLAKETRFAAQQLATALGELLTLTLPGGAEL